MLVEFKKLRVGDKFEPEIDIHGPIDGTRDGRLWERWQPDKPKAGGPVNARNADEFHPAISEFFHPQQLVQPVGCPYCDQVDYLIRLEWQINEFEPCSAAHSRIEGAIHSTYGTLLTMDTCHHLCGSDWDIAEEGKE